MQLSGGRHWRVAFGLVLGLALVVRIAIALSGPPGPTWVDGEQYWSIAQSLVRSGTYANAVPEPPGDLPYADLGPTSFWLPGYPLFLAAVILVFGELPLAVCLVQAFLSTLTVAVVGDLGRRLGGWGIGVVAAAIVTVSPLQLFQVGRIGSELLTALVLALLCWLLQVVLDAIRSGRGSYWLQIGLWTVCSFSVLLRSVFAPLAVLATGWVMSSQLRRGKRREAWLGLGLAAAIGLLVLLPWFARNLGLWGELVYNTKAGINLRIGFNEFADGRYTTLGIPRLEREALDELERDRVFREQAISWIRENPGPTAALAARKFFLFWSPFHEQHPVSSAKGAVVFLWSSFLLATAAWGTAVVLRSDRKRVAPLIAVILLYALVHMTAFGAVRFRIPLGVLLALLSAFGLVHLGRVLRAARPAH